MQLIENKRPILFTLFTFLTVVLLSVLGNSVDASDSLNTFTGNGSQSDP